MSRIKRAIEEWLDDAIDELDEVIEKFESHAVELDKIMLGESDVETENAELIAREMAEDFAMEGRQ